ncbi:hypothetical protein SDRG_14668 [Saprolegnia diclina VS20]|uniref:Uncharacterized protein n=1 Tax=Saprolegnia diclina (strain VS20) TaxID=1156394 RepID=T0PQ66_SAPDV|nr:hypothetical protein SDRG_14668 [Saprolegnia diclina VS20]EQC27619.1 hypothetical protein SDRG_14668 [Saprolegnia diclina VS20]|eukprot:XP_008619039.1 hypothetical protein SDRG_14668 [Saprolegnia diclina VS20]
MATDAATDAASTGVHGHRRRQLNTVSKLTFRRMATTLAPAAVAGDDWIDEASCSESDNEANVLDVDVLRAPAPTKQRRVGRFWSKKPTKSTTTSTKAARPATLPRGRYRMEMVATPEPHVPWVRRFYTSDFFDLVLVLLFWAAIGVGIYYLQIEVPDEYKTVVTVAVALTMLPLAMYAILHVYELRLRRARRFVKVSTD